MNEILKLDLNGEWDLHDETEEFRLKGTVPGCVHTDLLAADMISDPYFRDEENRVQWVGEKTWIYSREFTVAPEILNRPNVLLCCDGLDTLASVSLNGKEILSADNMYRKWEVDVRGTLTAGSNILEVRFAPTVPYITEKQAAATHRVSESSIANSGAFARGWIRKEPCNFGWDWGATLITCGIWRNISIQAFDARFNHVKISQTHSENRALLRIEPAVDGAAATVRATLQLMENAVAGTEQPAGGSLTLQIENPELWWPVNMGAQPLYTLCTELLAGDGTILDRQEKRIGLRTLELVQKEDAFGESFQFEANGIPFFAKGANWVPADTFANRAPANCRHLLESSAEANMNMIRVWGGGIYEPDGFYDLCDELGLVVWQDFMFTCSTYPVFDPQWMAGVRAEAVDNVRALHHHACIGLWCGNNELEMYHTGDAWTEKKMTWAAYDSLFNELLPDVVREEHPGCDYWPGSPATRRGDRTDFNNPHSGDAHLWDVWFREATGESYRDSKHRFISEFGFQGFPHPATVDAFTAPEDRRIDSAVMAQHQKNRKGIVTITDYMERRFHCAETFESQIWISQFHQAWIIQTGVEHWRRSMPRCMGALYWQLNDSWPVISWSSIDWFGRWKALHCAARRFFAPVLVSSIDNIIHLTNERTVPARGTLHWTLTDTRGSILEQDCAAVNCAPLTSAPVVQVDAGDGILWMDYEENGEILSSNTTLPAPEKELDLAPAALSHEIQFMDETTAQITIRTDRPALWVWLDFQGLEKSSFSDNFFHLRNGVEKTIALRLRDDIAPDRIASLLQIRSLTDLN